MVRPFQNPREGHSSRLADYLRTGHLECENFRVSGSGSGQFSSQLTDSGAQHDEQCEDNQWEGVCRDGCTGMSTYEALFPAVSYTVTVLAMAHAAGVHS